MARRGTRRQGGFTLVEVLVVVVVLALAAAVVGPAVGRGTETLRARAEVAGLASFLRHARQQAITRREAQEVRIDSGGHRVVLAAAGSSEARATRLLQGRVMIDAGAAATSAVRFLPHGLSTGAAWRLESPGGQVHMIVVEPLTGRVTQRRV